MPDRGSTQASPDMSLKRPTPGRGLEVKKKNRQHSACAQLIWYGPVPSGDYSLVSDEVSDEVSDYCL